MPNDAQGRTQEMILEQLRIHGQELHEIRGALEKLIRVEEKQANTETRLSIMIKRCDSHDERIRALEDTKNKQIPYWQLFEKGFMWLVLAGLIFYVGK